ncbi:MAG TPA: TetR/AcrR family transcriptional regulator [Terriglobales bacterium]
METRDRLFQAALRLFAKKGFANTTVEDITEAADVGKGTFFNYFRTKEHILSYFAEQQVASVIRWAQETHDSTEPVEERLHALVRTASKLPGNNPELVRAAMSSFFANEEIREDLRKQIALGRRVLARYLASALKQGRVRGGTSPILLARTFQQVVLGSVLLWSLHQDAPILSYLENAFEVLWHGMSPMAVNRNTGGAAIRRNRKEEQHGKRT